MTLNQPIKYSLAPEETMNRKILSIQVTDLNMMISPPSVFYLMLLFFGEMGELCFFLSNFYLLQIKVTQ